MRGILSSFQIEQPGSVALPLGQRSSPKPLPVPDGKPQSALSPSRPHSRRTSHSGLSGLSQNARERLTNPKNETLADPTAPAWRSVHMARSRSVWLTLATELLSDCPGQFYVLGHVPV